MKKFEWIKQQNSASYINLNMQPFSCQSGIRFYHVFWLSIFFMVLPLNREIKDSVKSHRAQSTVCILSSPLPYFPSLAPLSLTWQPVYCHCFYKIHLQWQYLLTGPLTASLLLMADASIWWLLGVSQLVHEQWLEALPIPSVLAKLSLPVSIPFKTQIRKCSMFL